MNKNKSRIKKVLYEILAVIGLCTGVLLTVLPQRGKVWVYKTLVHYNRLLPDTPSLHVHPFMTTLGRTLFRSSTPIWVNSEFYPGFKMALDVSEETQRQIFSHKRFEANISRFVDKLVRPGDTCVDIGSNVGYFTLLCAALTGSDGTVISIEAERGNFDILQKNCTANSFQQVRTFHVAAGAQQGEGVLHVNPLNRGGNSMHAFTEYKSGTTRLSKEEVERTFKKDDLSETIRVETFDSIYQREDLAQVRFCKIDVEGFEFEVIKGMRDTLRRGVIDVVVCEVNDPKDRKHVFDTFLQHGYKAFRLTFQGIPTLFQENIEDAYGNVAFIHEEAKDVPALPQ